MLKDITFSHCLVRLECNLQKLQQKASQKEQLKYIVLLLPEWIDLEKQGGDKKQ